MEDFKKYLYNDKKVIYYPSIYEHRKIILSRDENNVTININDVSITLPKEALKKVLDNEGGVVTIDKQQLKLKKLKSSNDIDLKIRDKNGNRENSFIEVVHFNIPEWHQFKYFLLGYTPIMILSATNEPIEKIGFSIYPYDLNSKDLKHIMEINQKTLFMRLIDHYDMEFDLDLNKNIKNREVYIQNLKNNINDYLKICKMPIIVQNLNKIEKVLDISLPKNRIYNIDDFISYEDFSNTIINPYTRNEKKLLIYGGTINKNGLTLSQMYFDKEILKNKDNNLDKLIEVNKEILYHNTISNETFVKKDLDSELDFNI